jgi:hypothetical protein
MGDSYTSLDLDFSQNSSGSLEASSSNWDQDHTQEHRVSAEKLRTIEVEVEPELKRGERRLRREAAKKRVAEVDVQQKSSSSGSLDASSSSWDQDHAKEHCVSAEQPQTIEVEEEHEHEHKREEGRRRREEEKNIMTEVDVQEKSSSSGSLDANSSNWDQDHAQEHCVSTEQLRAIEIEKEHNRKREERRLRREAAKKNMPEVDVPEEDVQDKSTVEDTREYTQSEIEEASRNDRLERAFLWYTRMGNPIRAEFKRQIARQEVDITREDADLLAWNENGTRVVNYTTMNAKIMTRMLKQSVTYL